jgi:hypothetical protein
VWEPLTRSLPDNTVRLASRQTSGTASAGFGPVKIGVEDSNYEVIVDYINSDVVNVPLVIQARHHGQPIDDFSLFNLSELPEDALLTVRRATERESEGGNTVTIPVYVGIGLRLTASVQVLKGQVDLSNLASLAAAAARSDVAGNMTVQTLGVSGSQVRAMLPLPSELNNTTIQNSILAIGSIKAIIDDDENTWTQVRVTGFYNPFADADSRFINAIRSELASSSIEWSRPCTSGQPAAVRRQ